MADDSSGKVLLRDVAIVGGGCYGTFYAGQLAQAKARGKADYRRLLVIDRDPACRFVRELGPADDRELVADDWDGFFDRWLARKDDGSGDAIVPSPLMPHLMFGWLSRRARARWPARRVEQQPLDPAADTPYDTLAPDGTRYVSFADWLCPVHCIEPAVCPVIRAPRSWEISDAAERLVERRALRSPSAGPVLFVCRHRVHGVGMFDVSAVLAGDATVARAGEAAEVGVVIGTVSGCHGALSLLHLGRTGPPPGPGPSLRSG